MKKQAFADRYPYGIFSCIRTMGHIYKSRGNFDLSAQYYQEALDYMLTVSYTHLTLPTIA